MIDEDLDQNNKREAIQDYSRKKRRGKNGLIGIILVVTIFMVILLYLYFK